MTRDEIPTMEAGREIDALIAENVMGWHVVDEHKTKHWYDSDGRYQHMVARDDGLYEDSEDFHLIFWHPSGSILWAWEVVEKLCNKTGCDIVKVCKRDPELYGAWSCNFGNGAEAFAETAELAICRAALLVVTP